MSAPAPRVNEGSSSVSSTLASNALAHRVAHERQALRARFLGTLALVGVASVGLVFALGAWLLAESRWLTLPRGIPVLIWLIGAALATGVVYWLRKREGDKQSVKAIAAAIEHEQGLRRGSLRGALEVGEQGVFGKFAADNVAARLPQAPTLVPKVHGRLMQRLAMAGGAALVAALLLVLSAKTATDGFAAVVHPVAAWRGLLLPALGFPGLPSSVPRGMPLTLKIAAQGRSTITLSRRAPGEAWADTVLTVDEETGLAQFPLGPVRAPIALRASDGRAPDAEVTLSIGDRGWVGEVSMQAIYPAYLGRTNETIEAVSPLRVPRGTVLVVSAEQHGGARDAVMTSGKDTVRFAATDDSAKVEARLTADHDGVWHWAAGATPRASNAGTVAGESMLPEVPEDLSLVIAPDAVPQVAILSPMSDTAIGVSGTLPLAFEALDDHGVTKIMLKVWREAAADVGKPVRVADVKSTELLVAQPDGPVWGGQGGLPLTGQNLEPGDRLHLVAVATDNSPWHQIGESAELVLKVPSLAEQRSMARALGDSLAAQAQRMASAEKKLAQSTSDASKQRDLKGAGNGDQSSGDKSDAAKAKDGNMSFASAERAKQVARDQRELAAKVDSMRASAKEMEQRLKDAGALDTALAKKMKEVQQMLRDAMTPEMQKQLQNLENASDRLSGTEAQKSMEQLAAQQQQMREQLEKSAEMLKRAALEGTMETLRDEARDLADAQQKLADKQSGKQSSKPNQSNNKQQAANKSAAGDKVNAPEMSAKEMADRTKDLEKEVENLRKKLEAQGAKPGAEHARQAEQNLEQGAQAAERAAKEAQQNGEQKPGQQEPGKELGAQQGQAQQKPGEQGKQQQGQQGQQQQGQQQGQPGQQGQQGQGQQGQQQQGQQGGQQQGQQGGQQRSGGQQQGGGQPGSSAQQAADAMDRAADQLAQARESQVEAWKQDLSQQLDQSINETMQLAKQQQSLENRMKQGGNAQSMQNEQGAIQQGVQQAAQRLEQAGRQSSLLSQRSQKAMADAAKRAEQATKAAGQPGNDAAQNAMKDATEALNQALSSLVKDREKVNSAESASGFSEMMEQLKKMGQQQGSLNQQMQALNMMPGGAQGQQAQQQARVLAKQQREVARSLADVSDADQTGRMEELAKEAQQVAAQMERGGPDPQVAARQAQLYRRLLDAGKFLEQNEKDDEGPREAKAADGSLSKAPADGVQSGKAANKFLAPTWNELRGLGAEERRLVLEYFRRLNSKP